ncbi:hypothetical protein M9Y10_038620 [Tritrichomonas musculus]|uniref:Uncharacterized protein n=1 Tax=Tritrichomonas musculus TaxID=1915356 RepID=A0ABR2KC36_9EUKA
MECSISSSFSDSSKKNSRIHSKNFTDLQNENALLIQKNVDLSAQLTNLRSQFDQALVVSSKIENVFSTNSEYSKEIAHLKSEKDDLNRRLQIALQNNQDLNYKLQNYANSQINVNENYGNFKRQKDKYDKIILDMQSKLDESNKENEFLKQNSEQFNMTMENIYQAASHFFNQIIDSPQILLDCFMHNKNNSESKDIIKLTKHIYKLKNQLKKKDYMIENYEKSKIQNEIDKNTIQVTENEFNYKISDLTAQLNELKDRNQTQSQQIDELTRKNESLIEELAQKNAQIKVNMFQNEDKQTIDIQQLNHKLISTQKLLTVTVKKNKQLKNKLFVIVCKAKSLEKKCHILRNSIKALEIRKGDLKCEIQRKADLHTQSEFKIKDVENSVLRAKDELNLQKKENDRLHGEIVQYENKLRQADRDYKELQEEKNHLISISQQFDGKIQAYENKLQAERARHENLERRLRDELSPLDPSNVIPPTILNSTDFPNELQTVIGEIGRNTAVNLTVRIQSAFSTIAKYFKAKFEEVEGQIKEERQKFSGLKTQVDSLLDFLSRLFPEVKINYELILSDEQTRNILGDTIRNLKEIQRIGPLIDEVNSTLGIQKFEDAKITIDELLRTIDEFQREIRKQKDLKRRTFKLSKLKEEELITEIQSIESEYNKLDSDFKELFSDKNSLQEKIFSIQNQMKEKEEILTNTYQKKINDLNEIILDLQNKLKSASSLNDIISKLTRSKERLESDIKLKQTQNEDDKKKYKQKVKIEREKYDQLLNQTRKQISESQSKIRELTDINSKFEASNSVLSANNNELLLRIKKLETKLNALQSEFERDKKSVESQCQAKLLFAETECKSKIEENKLQVDLMKKRLIDLISKTFSAYLDGLNVDENNFEGAIQLLKRKMDSIMNKESIIRGRFKFDSNQPLEDIISSLISRQRKSKY